ncbi:hypothetical protein [Ktedonospora formicarum]|uniref:PhoD-like phosphatase metallophosphatase domain-containing protein n=1 Tax=Ktedonospora formicarum TaxID=2778364 RepID=A0A8J3I0A3_9CHLR|nr:hypothetical protein [Ktedonospora formicarum]GHO44445.1 hypothetical protein KSX_26080 [Ktedonospora formicarum]
MPWTSLTNRIQDLPLILAGPILRRTEPGSITVWLALKEACLVTLHILEGSNQDQMQEQFQGIHKTVRLGENLHIVAVTARAQSTQEHLNWGSSYYYNLSFQTVEGNPQGDLHTPGILQHEPDDTLSSLAYPGHPFPGFVLPAEMLEDTRVFHGSCRKTHGTGQEMLAALDLLLEKAALEGQNAAVKRPQQLFLTGDQIYADDVTPPMLFALIDAGQALLGDNEELLPGVYQPASHYAPGLRRDIVHQQAMFTTKTPSSHILSLAEYAAMYLFSWSDQLWSSDLPGCEEVWHRYPTSKPATFAQQDHEDQYYQEWNTQLASFRAHLPHARRALANIATYMICDDHDITDDWFLDGAWCKNVLSSQLGYRVVRNGLLAYTLFQGWGNDPEQFEQASGRLLLAALDSWRGEHGTHTEHLIDELIGMPLPFDGQGELERSERALHWHYTYQAPCYQVIVLDTRTQRHYNKPEEFPGLLSEKALRKQIAPYTQAQSEVTILVSAAPVLGVDFIEAIQFWSRLRIHDNYAFDREAWGLEWGAFQRFLKTISKLRQVVILTGDVHYAFGSYMEYWDRHTGKTAKIVNFTASPLCNEGAGEHMAALAVGYPRLLQLLRRGRNPSMSFFAWDILPGNNLIPNYILSSIRKRLLRFWWSIPRLAAAQRSNREIILPAHGWFSGTFDAFPPDRSYRIHYLRNTLSPEVKQRKRGLLIRAYHALQQPQRLALRTVWLLESIVRRIRRGIIRQYNIEAQDTRVLLTRPLHAITNEVIQESEEIEQALEKRRGKIINTLLRNREWLNKWKAGSLIVGYNNIGEINFENMEVNGEQQHEVRQRLWWWKQESTGKEYILQNADYQASLELPMTTNEPPLP